MVMRQIVVTHHLGRCQRVGLHLSSCNTPATLAQVGNATALKSVSWPERWTSTWTCCTLTRRTQWRSFIVSFAALTILCELKRRMAAPESVVVKEGIRRNLADEFTWNSPMSFLSPVKVIYGENECRFAEVTKRQHEAAYRLGCPSLSVQLRADLFLKSELSRFRKVTRNTGKIQKFINYSKSAVAQYICFLRHFFSR